MEFPADGVELSVLRVISDLDRSVRFYRDILGARVTRTYGGTSAVLDFQGSWLLLVTGGPPTPTSRRLHSKHQSTRPSQP